MELRTVVETIKEHCAEFDSGYSETELQDIEHKYGFRFPPDLREFLSLIQPRIMKSEMAQAEENNEPVRPGWVDWRNTDEDVIRQRLDWPLEGILFDVRHGFWCRDFGRRPWFAALRKKAVRKALQKYATLIPIYAHRCIPDTPNHAGNPVFSVWQTDIIYYGGDLTEYLQNEFHIFNNEFWTREVEPRHIEFWSDLVEWNCSTSRVLKLDGDKLPIGEGGDLKALLPGGDTDSEEEEASGP